MGDQPRRATERVPELFETVVYAAIGVVLIAGAVLSLGAVAYHLVVDTDDGVKNAVTEALDGLLLAFIFLELFSAVKATVETRTLVAEPFLLVGMIASIKELVLLSLEATPGTPEFGDSMIELGILAAITLGLAVATLLVRRKEREPEEA